jgi:hypothetical protein
MNTKEEADRLACTGEYARAARMYAALGLKEQAAYYARLAKVERS